MKTYAITIEEETFGEFNCEIKAENEEKAIEIAKEHYACSLGAFDGDIVILAINQIFI